MVEMEGTGDGEHGRVNLKKNVAFRGSGIGGRVDRVALELMEPAAQAGIVDVYFDRGKA